MRSCFFPVLPFSLVSLWFISWLINDRKSVKNVKIFWSIRIWKEIGKKRSVPWHSRTVALQQWAGRVVGAGDGLGGTGAGQLLTLHSVWPLPHKAFYTTCPTWSNVREMFRPPPSPARDPPRRPNPARSHSCHALLPWYPRPLPPTVSPPPAEIRNESFMKTLKV